MLLYFCFVVVVTNIKIFKDEKSHKTMDKQKELKSI